MTDTGVAWAVLGVLLSVSVFSTGFLSVRIHAAVDRALGRADALDAEIRQTTPEEFSVSVQHSVATMRDLGRPDAVNLATLWVNVAVFLLMSLIVVAIGYSERWRTAARMSEVSLSFWSAAALLLCEFAIVTLGVIENYTVARRAQDMLRGFVVPRALAAEDMWAELADCATAEIANMYSSIGSAYHALAKDVRNWSYVHRASGVAYLRCALIRQSRRSWLASDAWSRAVDALRNAVAASPQSEPIRVAAVDALLCYGVPSEAAQHCRWLLRHGRTNDVRAAAATNLAIIQMLRGDELGARDTVNAILRSKWVCAELCHNLSIWFDQQQGTAIALAFANVAEFLENRILHRSHWTRRVPLVWGMQPGYVGPWRFYITETGPWVDRWLMVEGSERRPRDWVAEWQRIDASPHVETLFERLQRHREYRPPIEEGA